jgi:hypothetical protein
MPEGRVSSIFMVFTAAFTTNYRQLGHQSYLGPKSLSPVKLELRQEFSRLHEAVQSASQHTHIRQPSPERIASQLYSIPVARLVMYLRIIFIRQLALLPLSGELRCETIRS